MSLPKTLLEPEVVAVFSEEARRAVYECIALRRDIRHFQPGVAVDPAVLTRILAPFSKPYGTFCP